MNRLPLLAITRTLWRHPAQAMLSIVGLALGVMVFTAVDTATISAERAFMASLNALSGRATHHIVGGPVGLSDELYVRLRRDLGVVRSAPVSETTVRAGALSLQLLGVDLFAEREFRGFVANSALRADVWRSLLLEPGAVLMGDSMMERLALQAGDALEVQHAGYPVRLHVVGTLDNTATQGIDDLLVADIATVKELLNQPHRLTRIDLVLNAQDTATPSLITAALPPDARLITSSSRARSVQELTRAFTLNLQAMSLLAVFIGAFLIYNTMHFTMLRRRPVVGALRALGVSRLQLLITVAVEALLLGLVAVAIGVLAGTLTARFLLVLVSQTINDLYFTLAVGEAALTTSTALRATIIGVAGSLFAALAPAIEMLRVDPVAAMQRRSIERRTHAWLLPLAGVGAILVAVAIIASATTTSLAAGFAALSALLLGGSLLVPLATVLAARFIRRLSSRALLRQAVSGITAGISRLAVAQAALVVALAATVGVALMITSFRVAVEQWLEATLRADVYVRATGTVGSGLTPEVMTKIRGLPNVRDLSVGRFVELPTDEGNLSLFALQPADESYRSIRLLRALPDAWRQFDRDDAVLVSEPFAFHQRVEPGDRLSLTTRSGAREFLIAGVYRDYGSEKGIVMMRLSLYRDLWADNVVSSLGVYLEDKTATQQAVESIRNATVDLQQLRVRSNRELRALSLEVFDRTFEITRVLRWLTIIVATVAIVTSLGAVQLERRREIALLRSIGTSPGQITVLITVQNAVLGAIAGVLTLPMGVALSALLIDVINQRAFGWSMSFSWSWPPLIEALATAVAVAVIAGVIPALRAGRGDPAEALRGE